MQGYTPPAAGSSQYQSIPMDKIEDFGVHANAYYPLKVEIYKSKLDEKMLDLLWNKYWVATLSSNSLVSVSLSQPGYRCGDLGAETSHQNLEYSTSQVQDLNAKLRAASQSISKSSLKLKLKPSQPTTKSKETTEGSDKKSKEGEKEFSGVEEEETPLNKVTQERSVV